MQRKLAEHICLTLLDCSGKLDQSIIALEGSVDSDFLPRYKRSVGEVMGKFFDVLRSIFDEHVDLMPDSMK